MFQNAVKKCLTGNYWNAWYCDLNDPERIVDVLARNEGIDHPINNNFSPRPSPFYIENAIVKKWLKNLTDTLLQTLPIANIFPIGNIKIMKESTMARADNFAVSGISIGKGEQGLSLQE